MAGSQTTVGWWVYAVGLPLDLEVHKLSPTHATLAGNFNKVPCCPWYCIFTLGHKERWETVTQSSENYRNYTTQKTHHVQSFCWNTVLQFPYHTHKSNTFQPCGCFQWAGCHHCIVADFGLGGVGACHVYGLMKDNQKWYKVETYGRLIVIVSSFCKVGCCFFFFHF